MEENYDIWTEGSNFSLEKKEVDFEEIDYVVIGGGITGITTAYFLSKKGFKVALFEKLELGVWSTCATTGFLTQMLDYQPNKYVEKLGLDKTRLLYKSHNDAINEVEKIIVEEKIDCDFNRCPSYIYANNKGEEKEIQRLLETYKSIGLNAEFKSEKILGNDFGHIELTDGAMFNPMKYIRELAKKIINNGGQIFERTKVLNITDGLDGVIVELKNGKKIKAKKVFTATAFLSLVPEKHKHHVVKYRTFVCEYYIKGDYLSALYEDINEPYNYFRIENIFDKKRVIIGGCDVLDAASGDRTSFFNNVRKYSKNIFKDNILEEIRFWSGEIDMELDYVPHIGFMGNTFYAFGFGGNGLTYSMTAAKIFIDSIESKNNEYTELFSFENR